MAGLLAVLMSVGCCALAQTAQPVVPQAPERGTPLSEVTTLQDQVNRLAAMAASLKVTVDGTRKDELSMEVLREADRIEKLAAAVKRGAHK